MKRVPEPDDVGVSAVVLAPFVAAVALLVVTARFTGSNLAAADPLVRLVGGPWPLFVICVVVVVAALRLAPPSRAALRRALPWALGGVATAAAIVGLLRLAVGEDLPSFIPPEESSRPGIALGLAAGTVEEAIFRVALLFPMYSVLAKRTSKPIAIAATCLGVGLLFALSHELAGDPFELRYFVTRVVVPGALFSAAAFALGMPFLVAAHCTAHLLIPYAFR